MLLLCNSNVTSKKAELTFLRKKHGQKACFLLEGQSDGVLSHLVLTSNTEHLGLGVNALNFKPTLTLVASVNS